VPDKIEVVEEEVVASIVYSIKNTGECIVDIEIEEIDEVVVELFANLYFGISTHKFSESTVSLIKEGMEEAGEGEMYDYFCNKLQEVAKIEMKGILDNKKDNPETSIPRIRKESEEPCVSPIDFLTGG
jgi:hypothetical protein